jgi:hypothetical protein
MVLVDRQTLDAALHQIKQDALSLPCSVLVLVANDVDALCAARVLCVTYYMIY